MSISKDELWIAALIFEKQVGVPLEDYELMEIENSRLSKHSAEQIEEMITKALNTQEPSFRISAY